MLIITICVWGFIFLAKDLLGAEPAPETGPNLNEKARQELPYPLPLDFNECVHVVWGEKAQKVLDARGSFYDPPLSPQAIREINEGMRQGWGVYTRCSNEAA